MPETLNMCPFCGGKAYLHEDRPDCSHYPTTYEVNCESNGCGACGSCCDTASEAISAWNARAGEQRLVEALKGTMADIRHFQSVHKASPEDLESYRQAQAALKTAKGD